MAVLGCRVLWACLSMMIDYMKFSREGVLLFLVQRHAACIGIERNDRLSLKI